MQEKADRDEKAAREANEKAADRDRRDAESRAENQRQYAEALRQAHLRAVAATASQIKEIWQDRIRNAVPELMGETQTFRGLIQGFYRGDKSMSLSELVVSGDKLLGRVESAKAWINDPFKTYSDQVVADAVNVVRSQNDYRQEDARLENIFGAIKTINEIVHKGNPFAKTWNASVYSELEQQFQSTLGAAKVLETHIGSFKYAAARSEDPMRSNPFLKPSIALEREVSGNPWTDKNTVQEPRQTMLEPLASGEQNPFKLADKSTVISSSDGERSTNKAKKTESCNKGRTLRTDCERKGNPSIPGKSTK